jgi:outer membrane immunogenic protein
MTRMTKAILTFATCAVLGIPSLASAQTRSASGYEWTGVYAGFSVGYGGAFGDVTFTPMPSEEVFGIRATTLKPSPSGWLYGFHFGWNQTRGTGVWGIEGDFNWSTMSGESDVHPVVGVNGSALDMTLHADQNLGWITSIRGRYGLIVNGCLIYATGGVAFAEVNNFAETDTAPAGLIVYSTSENARRTGWTIGAGIEGGFNERWGWRAQYLYLDFGSNEATANPNPPTPFVAMQHTFKNATNAFTFGFNYRF